MVAMSAREPCLRGFVGAMSTWASQFVSSPVFCAPKPTETRQSSSPVAENALAPHVPGMRPLGEPLRKNRRKFGPLPQYEALAAGLPITSSGSSIVRRSREALGNAGRLPSETEKLSVRLLHGRTTTQLCALMSMSLLSPGEEAEAAGSDLQPMQGLTAIAEHGDIVMVVDTFTWRHLSKADVASILPSDDVDGCFVLANVRTCPAASLDILGLIYEAAPQKSGKLLFRLRESQRSDIATASLQTIMARTRHYAGSFRAGFGCEGMAPFSVSDAVHIESAAAKAHQSQFPEHSLHRRADKAHSEFVLTFPLPIPVDLTPFECVSCRHQRIPGRYFPITDADLRVQFPDVQVHRTTRKGRLLISQSMLIELLLNVYQEFNIRASVRRIMDVYSVNFLSLVARKAMEGMAGGPLDVTWLARSLPDSEEVTCVLLRAWSGFIRTMVGRMRKRQLLFNAKVIRGDGNFKLAKRIARYEGQKWVRPFTVVLGWCGLDGSLLQPWSARKGEVWSAIRSDLEPLLKDVRDFGLEANYSLAQTQPVAHSTDTYRKHRWLLGALYDEVWAALRVQVQALTPRGEALAAHPAPVRLRNEQNRCRLTGEPWHVSHWAKSAASWSANDYRNYCYDIGDVLSRLSAPHAGAQEPLPHSALESRAESERPGEEEVERRETECASATESESQGSGAGQSEELLGSECEDADGSAEASESEEVGLTAEYQLSESDGESSVKGSHASGAESEGEMDPVDELLRVAVQEPSDIFQGKLSDADEDVARELRELLERKDARDDPRWRRLCDARPTRGTLLRTARSAGVRIHPDNGWLNYKDLEEFREAVEEMEPWYRPGRRVKRRRRRGIVRTEDASDRVVGRRTVWSKKVAAVHARMLDPVTLEGLWNWREVALALRDADLAVLSGTTPVERLWGNAECFFPKDARRIAEPWFNFLSDLAYLRYNYRHFHHKTLPTWTRGDSLLAERADLLWEIGRGLQNPEAWHVARALEAAFEESIPLEAVPNRQEKGAVDLAKARSRASQQDESALVSAADVSGVLPLTIWTVAPLAKARRLCERILGEEIAFRHRASDVADLFDGAQTWSCLRSIRSRILALGLRLMQGGVLSRDATAHLLRNMGGALGDACSDLVLAADSTLGSYIAAPAGHCRVLELRWSDAVASGQKFVEFVAYAKKWTNIFKCAERGCLIVIGGKGTHSVCAVAVLNGVSGKNLSPNAREVEDAICRVHAMHHEPLRSFIQGASRIDFVEFDIVFDVRALCFSWRDLFAALGVSGPRVMQGAPMLVQRETPAASRLLCVCGCSGVVRRSL